MASLQKLTKREAESKKQKAESERLEAERMINKKKEVALRKATSFFC
jgi:hypothetical protein